MNNKPAWRGEGTIPFSMRSIKQVYEREPVIQVSIQLVLSVFAVAFFGFAAIKPTLATISTLLKKIDDQKEVEQKLDVKIQQLAVAQENLIVFADDLPLVYRAIPEGAALNQLTREIEAVANESGVYVTSIQFQPVPLSGEKLSLLEESKAKPPRGEQFVTFSFTAGGDLGGLSDFLGLLEKMERVVAITSLTLSRPGSNLKEQFQLIVAGKGTAYYLPRSDG